MSRAADASTNEQPVRLEDNPPVEAFQQRLDIHRGWSVALLCMLTAVLWQVIFPPFDLGWLAYIVLVPWGLAVAGAHRQRTALLWGWLSGVAVFAVGLYWLTWITLIGYAALVVVLSVYWLAATWVVRRAFILRMPIWLVLPVTWVALEFIRGWLISGFPWFFLAHSQYRYTTLIQITDVTGQYGVSFFVAMVNGLLIDLMAQPLFVRTRGRKRTGSRLNRFLPAGLATAAASLVFLLGYGTFRLAQADEFAEPGPRIGVVQHAFPNTLTGRNATEEKIFYDYLAQTEPLLDRDVDLIVWPETILPSRFNEPWEIMDADRLADAEAAAYVRGMQQMQRDMAELLEQAGVPLLGGAATYRLAPQDTYYAHERVMYNSVLMLRAANAGNAATTSPGAAPSLRTTGIYDKMHCVPFGEYVPFREGFPALHRFLRGFVPAVMEQLQPGREIKRFTIRSGDRTYTLAAPICYEGVFDRVCRRMVYEDGVKKANILVNLSNDGWFIAQSGKWRHAATELDQHLSAYVFRAIENRVPVVRAVNTGMSGFVDSSGRILELVEQPELGLVKLAVGSADREVLVDSRRSLYSFIGDASGWACTAWAGVLVLVIIVRTRKLPGDQSPKGSSSGSPARR